MSKTRDMVKTQHWRSGWCSNGGRSNHDFCHDPACTCWCHPKAEDQPLTAEEIEGLAPPEVTS